MVFRGKHTEATKQKMRLAALGPKNHNWKGNDVQLGPARCRDNRKFKPVLVMLKEITHTKWEVHHIDGNDRNHSDDNIALITRKGHMTIDGRLLALADTQFKPKFRVKKHKGAIYVKSSSCKDDVKL